MRFFPNACVFTLGLAACSSGTGSVGKLADFSTSEIETFSADVTELAASFEEGAGRVPTGDMPTTGSANYSGGWISGNAAQTHFYAGALDLSADFAGSTISGSGTDNVVFQADVVLAPGATVSLSDIRNIELLSGDLTVTSGSISGNEANIDMAGIINGNLPGFPSRTATLTLRTDANFVTDGTDTYIYGGEGSFGFNVMAGSLLLDDSGDEEGIFLAVEE